MVTSTRFYSCLVCLVGLITLFTACTPAPAATDADLAQSILTPVQPTKTEEPQAEVISTPAEVTDPYLDDRLKMVDSTIAARGVEDTNVLRAMRDVPRHEFVPEDYLRQAYDDHPLPIGFGQTISQPFIVAWMTELLELEPGDKVLEIGTGSGYQAAVLAELGEIKVYSVEIVPELASRAVERLSRLGYGVRVKEGNGYFGWEENAPYDAIIVTAAPDHLPQSLVQQLVESGILVIPIGPPGGYQSLWQFVKTGDTVQAINLGGVMFVPFTGGGVGDSSPDLP